MDKMITIKLGLKEISVEKREYSFVELVNLMYPNVSEQDAQAGYIIKYRKKNDDKSTQLPKNASLKLKDGMIINVSGTGQS